MGAVAGVIGCALVASACLDGSSGPTDASVLFSIPVQTVRLPAVADTDVAVTRPNSNFGYEPTLSVKRHRRALLRFDETSVANAIGSGRLISAAIELEIDADSHDRTAEHPLDLHQLTLSWTEEGATWNCADDENTSGPSSNCAFDDRWKMGGRGPIPWESQPSVSLVVPKNPPGPVVFDVTSDVAALLSGAPNHGWIINRAPGSHRSARASLVSAEAGDGPQLVISFESNEVPPDPPEVAELASVFPDADTTIKRARPNKNFGDEPVLAVRGGIFRRRALLRVDTAAVSTALDGQPLLRAELEFSVADSRFWRRGTLALHRLTLSFTESGATWNCANDTNTGNHRQDCDPADEWEMGFFGENPGIAWPPTSVWCPTTRPQAAGPPRNQVCSKMERTSTAMPGSTPSDSVCPAPSNSQPMLGCRGSRGSGVARVLPLNSFGRKEGVVLVE